AEAAVGTIIGLSTFLHTGRSTAPAARAVQHRQRAVETLQDDLSRILFGAALIRPLAGLQRPFDVELGALLHILFDDLAQRFAKYNDAMPLGLFLALAGRLVTPRLARRQAQVGDRPTVLRAANFRVLADVADQNDLIDRTCHSLVSLRNWRRVSRARIAVPEAVWLYQRTSVECQKIPNGH